MVIRLALSKSEKELINAIVDSQLRLEAMLAGRMLPGLGMGVSLMHENPLNSPLILDAEDRRNIAMHGGRTGKRLARKITRKRKRKVSPYQKEFGRQFKAMKKKHPRTSVSVLMKKSHRATKRKMKK